MNVEALVAKHEATGESAPLQQAFAIWEQYRLVYYLFNLVRLGHPGALEKAAEVMAEWQRVPDDFTVFVHQGYESLPAENYTQLQACAVGRPMVTWIRNYWLLRKALATPHEQQRDGSQIPSSRLNGSPLPTIRDGTSRFSPIAVDRS
jgi:hypothetical protein